MVESYSSPCLVYEPGAAPTSPPEVFRATPGVVVTPRRPPPDPPSGGITGDPDEAITWYGALPYIFKPPAELLTGKIDSITGELRDEPYNPNTYRPKTAQESFEIGVAKKGATYDPDYSFKKYDPSSNKSTLVTNNSNKNLSKYIYKDLKLIERYRKGLDSIDLYPIFNLRNQYDKLQDNLSEGLKKTVEGLNSKDRQKFLDLVFSTIVDGRIASDDFYYRKTVLNKRGNRKVPTTNGVNSVNKAYNFFQKNKQAVDPEKFDNLKQQKDLQTFKFIPSDINKRFSVLSRSIGETQVTINDDDSYILVQQDGTELIDYINDGDTVDIRESNGSITKKALITDIDRTYYTSIDTLEDIFSLLNDEYRIDLAVTTNTSSMAEENFNLVSPYNQQYFLQLDNTTITDLEYEKLGIKKTSCEYTLQNVEEDFNDYVKFKAFPYLVLPIPNDDPIIANIFRSGGVTLTFKDIDFEGYDDILPRRIPYHIVIVPTDTEQLNFYNNESQITEFTDSITTRKLSFELNPDEFTRKPGIRHMYLSREYTYPDLNIEGLSDTQGIKYGFELSKNISTRQYKTGSEVLPRKAKGIRTFLRVMTSLQDNYELESSLTWFDVLSRLSFYELNNLLFNNSSNLFNRLANTGIKNGVRFTTSKRNFQTGLRGLTGLDEYEVITNPGPFSL